VIPPPLDTLDRAARLVGDRWSLLILGALLNGERRYNDLHDEIDGISTNVLAQRLSTLEAGGLIIAEPYSRRPLRMRYALTAEGRALSAALTALAAWGAGQDSAAVAGPRHDVCGSRLELRWVCPTCDPLQEERARELGNGDQLTFRS
jgi:DNA-binding HxlR family transcriptional regulator